MKISMVLLAFGLFRFSASEKLGPGYLPPPSAKYAGGESGDLQIPLEHPTHTPVYKSGFDVAIEEPKAINNFVGKNEYSYKITERPNSLPSFKSGSDKIIQRPEYQNGFTETNTINNDQVLGVKKFSTHSKNPSKYTETYAISGSATTIPPLGLGTDTSVEDIDGSLSYRYPINEEKIVQKQDQYEKPVSVSTDSDDITKIYQPNAFRMYGGIPMIIKTNTGVFNNNFRTVTHLGSNQLNHSYPLDDLFTTDGKSGLISQKSEFRGSLSPIEMKTQSSINSVISSQQNIGPRTNYRKPERAREEIDRNAVILSYKNMQTPEEYAYNFETSHGIKMDEKATTKDGVRAQGSYSYIGDDGKVYSLSYVADENGFQPSGSHLPTPPPIPAAIQKVIEQALRDKDAGIIHDGFYDEDKYGHLKYERPLSKYIQKVQKNTELETRNGVESKKQKIPNINGLTQRNMISERKFDPVNNLQDHFSIKSQNDQKGFTDHHNDENTNGYQQPKIISENKKTNVQLSRYPIQTENITEHPASKVNKQNLPQKSESEDKMILKINKNDKKNMKTNNIYKITKGNGNSHEVIELNNEGYYYVPPSSLFIEGRLQGKQRKPISQYGKNNNNIKENSVPDTVLNGQNDITEQFSLKVTHNNIPFSTTEEPLYQQTSKINYPKYDTNLNSDQLIADKQNSFNKVPMQIIDTVPDVKFNEDAVTKLSVHDKTEITTPAGNLFPKTMNSIAIPSIKNDIAINIYQSTTPLPPQTNTIHILRSNQYETTNDPVKIADVEEQSNEGYLKTTPDVPAIFEELSSQTLKPININTQDDTTNIQVDGFGRPIEETSVRYLNNLGKYNQDKDYFKMYDQKPKTNNSFTTGAPNNIKVDDGELHLADTTTNYYEKPEASNNVNAEGSDLQFSETPNLEPKGTTLRYTDDEIMLPGVIGEDFSGPKQPQKFDPETGYYY